MADLTDSIFRIYEYDLDGKCSRERGVLSVELDAQTLEIFQQLLTRLSSDLELPLEADVPGEISFLDFRIGSDGLAAYVLYYFHDEVLLASLILPGVDSQAEDELIDVFRFLLLDTEDLDEPSELEIDSVLNSKLFDFSNLLQRPAVITISFSQVPSDSPALDHAINMNLHLAKAFFDRALQIGDGSLD